MCPTRTGTNWDMVQVGPGAAGDPVWVLTRLGAMLWPLKTVSESNNLDPTEFWSRLGLVLVLTETFPWRRWAKAPAGRRWLYVQLDGRHGDRWDAAEGRTGLMWRSSQRRHQMAADQTIHLESTQFQGFNSGSKASFRSNWTYVVTKGNIVTGCAIKWHFVAGDHMIPAL